VHYQYIPYLLFSFFSALVIICICWYAWKNRNVRGAVYLFITLALVLVWIISQALEFAATNLQTKIFWANVQYLPITFAPAAYLSMVIIYTGREYWFKHRWFTVLLISIPVIVNILFWTNDFHSLMRQNIYLDNSGSFPVVGKNYGVLFWLFAVYNTFVAFISLILLGEGCKRAVFFAVCKPLFFKNNI